MHWTDGHIIQFLTTKGNMVSECIMPVELDKDINIATMSALGKFRNSKILIFCIYSHSHEEEDLSSATYQKILKDVLAAIPIDPDKTPVWAGWIRDKKIAWRNAAIKLVAICPEEEDKNEPSQQN
jgi:hypothetical protein